MLLKKKIHLFSFVFILSFSVLVLAAVYAVTRKLLIREERRSFEALTALFKKNVASALAVQEYNTVKLFLHDIAGSPGVDLACIMDETGKVLYSFRNGKEDLEFCSAAFKINEKDIFCVRDIGGTETDCLLSEIKILEEVWGYTGIGFSTKNRKALFRAYFFNLVVSGAVFFLLAFLVVTLAINRFFKPVAYLKKCIERTASGNYDSLEGIRLRKSENEFYNLLFEFKKMTASIRERDEKLVQLNRELKSAQDLLVKKERFAAIGHLAAGASHELNNPLVGVIGNVQVLKKKVKDPALSENLDRIERSAERCREIINKLLTYSSEKQPELRKLRLADAVNEALFDFNTSLSEMNIAVSVKNIDLTVTSDRKSLVQVFQNLIKNAAESMETIKNQAKKSLEISAEKKEISGKSFYCVVFLDTGPGLTEENRKRLFEPFYTTKPAGKGIGLGLFFSQNIMKSLGGELSAGSPSAGAEFIVFIPEK